MFGLMLLLAVNQPLGGQAKPGAVRLDVGQCLNTKVKAVDAAADGSTSITFQNGIRQVAVKPTAKMSAAKVGDPVVLCVGKLGSHCAAGLTKGATYHAKNLRTGEDWLAPDQSGKCGV